MHFLKNENFLDRYLYIIPKYDKIKDKYVIMRRIRGRVGTCRVTN